MQQTQLAMFASCKPRKHRVLVTALAILKCSLCQLHRRVVGFGRNSRNLLPSYSRTHAEIPHWWVKRIGTFCQWHLQCTRFFNLTAEAEVLCASVLIRVQMQLFLGAFGPKSDHFWVNFLPSALQVLSLGLRLACI